MYHALRMDEHLYLVSRYAEKPLRFSHLKSLVHEGSGVDGYLGAHIPGRMLEGIGCRHLLQLLVGEIAERSARTGKEYLVDLVLILAHQALEDSAMFAIHREDRRMILLSQLADEFTCHNEGFLIGQTDFLAGLDGMDGWFQSREAHHRGKHHVDRISLHDVAESLCTCIDLDVRFVAEQILQFLIKCLIGDDDGSRMKLVRLGSQFLHTMVGSEAIDLVKVAMLFDDIQRLCADASRRTENTYLLFFITLEIRTSEE